MTPEQARDFYKIEPPHAAKFAVGPFRCPDERCGEGPVKLAVPHPDDPEQTPNRCPTCLSTLVPDVVEIERRCDIGEAS